MNVLQILKFSPEFGGGMVDHLSALGERLKQDRIQITYAFPKRQAWFDHLAVYGNVLEIPEILTPWRSAFLRAVRRQNADIVHLHFSFALALAFLRSSRKEMPRIVYHWHCIPRPLLPSEVRSPARRFRPVATGLARLADRRVIHRHVTVSREILDNLVGQGWTRPKKIDHIPNAVRSTQGSAVLSPPAKNGDVVIGMVANFRAQKDHDTLLRAFARIADRYPHARLELVGDGPTRPAIEDLAATMHVSDRVTFRGTLLDVDPAYRQFDIFVLSTHHEGHPLSLLEAMSHGLPFVATDLPSVREVLPESHRAHLVPARDPEALASGLSRLIADRDGRKRWGEAARRIADANFRMERWADRVADVYKSVVSST